MQVCTNFSGFSVYVYVCDLKKSKFLKAYNPLNGIKTGISSAIVKVLKLLILSNFKLPIMLLYSSCWQGAMAEELWPVDAISTTNSKLYFMSADASMYF